MLRSVADKWHPETLGRRGRRSDWRDSRLPPPGSIPFQARLFNPRVSPRFPHRARPSTSISIHLYALSSRSFSRAGYHPSPRGRFFNPLFFFPTWFVFFLRRLRSARLRCSDNREPSESLSTFFSHLTRLPCPSSPFHLSLHHLLLLPLAHRFPPSRSYPYFTSHDLSLVLPPSLSPLAALHNPPDTGQASGHVNVSSANHAPDDVIRRGSHGPGERRLSPDA